MEDQQHRDTTREYDEMMQKASEQSRKIAEATASVNERAAKAGADVATHGARTVQDMLQSGGQFATTLADRSADQFSKTLGLTGEDAQRAAEQATTNMEAIAASTSVLTELGQNATREWLDFARARLEENIDQFGRLAQCRTLHDVLSVQSDLLRCNLEGLVQFSRRIAEKSARATEEATRKASERIRAA